MKNISPRRSRFPLLLAAAACLTPFRSQAATLLNSWETGTEGWTNAPGGTNTLGTSTAFSSEGTQSLRITNIAYGGRNILAQRIFTTGFSQPWNTLGEISLDLNFNWANRPAGAGNTNADFSISLYTESGGEMNLGWYELVNGNRHISYSIGRVINIPPETPWNRISFNFYWEVFSSGARGTPSLMMDNFRAMPVPEPSSLLLLAGPVAALGFRRQRRG